MTTVADERPDGASVAPAPPVRRRRAVLGSVVALVPAALIAVLGWAHRWIDEDAYINLRIVEQIYAGHGPVFNAGERVEAATSTLWLAVLVLLRGPLGLFLDDEWIAVIASLAFAVAAFAVAGWATRRLHAREAGVAVPVGLTLVAAVTVVWDFATSGLEMGLTWLWIAASWFVLVEAARNEELVGRRRTWSAVVLGSAVLVRPDLGLMMVSLIAAWFALVRPRRILRDLVAMFAAPLAFQVFRMGFYAALVPSTALAKDAGGLHVHQGLDYAKDFVDPYKLWVTGLLFVAVIVIRLVRGVERRTIVAGAGMAAAGVLHAAYIVAIGGDYMHGRLLLPAFFAVALPVSIAVDRRRIPELTITGLTALWALVTIASFRPPPPPPGSFVANVADWRTVSGAKVHLDDGVIGMKGTEAADAYAHGTRGYFRVASTTAIPSLDPNAFVYTLGSIGVPAYDAGRQVWVVDIGGLAEPLAARTDPVPDRPAGHRKQVDPAWYDARFAAPSPDDGPAVVAARHALTCGPGKELLTAVDGDLTPGRFLSNIWHSASLTRLHVPADPIVAEREWCGTG